MHAALLTMHSNMSELIPIENNKFQKNSWNIFSLKQ